MTKHIHVHLHDSKDGGTSTQRKSGGVTTWGGADPKKVVPKSPIDQLYKKSKDAGTSEGAKKAAETRKAHSNFSVVKEGNRAAKYHVIHNETKLAHHVGEPTFTGAQGHRGAIEQRGFGPVTPQMKWNGTKLVPQ